MAESFPLIVKETAMRDSEPKHLVQLDGLRGIAVVFVLIGHFHPITGPVYTLFPWGELGVHLFFVLSGFLITSILLRCRTLVESEQQSSAGAIRQFYIRRFLRIFPLYYATLGILAWLDYPDLRESIGWHLSYLSNYYFIISNSGHGRIAHFWTLAVEEQFYLTWPFLILLLPRRRLLPLVVAVIVIAPLFRLGVSATLPKEYYLARWWALFANLDTIGMGALLALLSDRGSGLVRFRAIAVRMGIWIGGPMLGLFLVFYFFHSFPPGVEIVLLRSAMAIFFLWLVGRAAEGFAGFPGRVLAWSPLLYIGKISYGIYVIHFFMIELNKYLFSLADLDFDLLPVPVQVILDCAATILLATLSWYAFESPLNGLKRYFTYEKRLPHVPLEHAAITRGGTNES